MGVSRTFHHRTLTTVIFSEKRLGVYNQGRKFSLVDGVQFSDPSAQ